MTDQERKSPAPSCESHRAEYQNRSNSTKKSPPFARQLRKGATLFVLVGTEAWDWAKDQWMAGAKVVLPPDHHPDEYRWNIAQSFQDAVIVAAGHPPPFDIIAALAASLLAYLDLVIYLDPEGLAMRLNPARRTA